MNNLNKKEIAQEVQVQEQYVGKCEHCNKVNKVKLPIQIKAPEFCMKCGKKIDYLASSTASLNNVRQPHVVKHPLKQILP